MKMARFVTGLILLAGCMIPARAADRAELERTFEDVLDCIRQSNAEGLAEHFHPEAVIFLRNRLFPLDFREIGKQGFDDLLKSFTADVVAADLRPMDISYRVVGGVGVVWGLAQFHIDAKKGPGTSYQSRISVVFAQVDGSWKIVHWHSSAIPGAPSATSP